MKDYGRFIAFIIFFTAGILWLNSVLPCPANLFGYSLPCPLFSLGTITIIITGAFLIWDFLLWKMKVLPISLLGKLMGCHDFPNLNGSWTISYSSSYKYDYENDKYITTGEGKATIDQTYSKLFVNGIFGESSEFESFSYKLQQKENGKWFLIYAYRNKPIDIKLKSSPNGGMHEGFCYLEINKNCKEMKGYYSNDEHRKTRGSIVFKKK